MPNLGLGSKRKPAAKKKIAGEKKTRKKK
jgi:hypothetical protein